MTALSALLPVLLAAGCNQKPDEGTFVGNPGKMDVAAAPTARVSMRTGTGTVDGLVLSDCDAGRTAVDLGRSAVQLSFDGLTAIADPPLTLPAGTWCGLELSLSALSLSAATDDADFAIELVDLEVVMSGGELVIDEGTYGLQLAHPDWLDLLLDRTELSTSDLAELQARIEGSSALVVAQAGTDAPISAGQDGAEGGNNIDESSVVWAGEERPEVEPTPTEPTGPTGPTADTGTPTETADTRPPTEPTGPTADTGTPPTRFIALDWSADPDTAYIGSAPSLAVGTDVAVMAYEDPIGFLSFAYGPPWLGLDTGVSLQLQGTNPFLAADALDSVLLAYDQGSNSPGIARLGVQGEVEQVGDSQGLAGTAYGAEIATTSGLVFVSWFQMGNDDTTTAVLQTFQYDELYPLDAPVPIGSSVVDPPGLATGTDGSVAVVWTERTSSPFGLDTHEVWGRRYAPQGAATTFRVDTTGSTGAGEADIAVGDSGIAAAWSDGGVIHYRPFTHDGIPEGTELVLGDATSPPTLVWHSSELLLVLWTAGPTLHVASIDPVQHTLDNIGTLELGQGDVAQLAVAGLDDGDPLASRITLAWSGDVDGDGLLDLHWAELTATLQP